ncbi:ROK family protein [bacterium]|nr:ROK family protein [bacterium]
MEKVVGIDLGGTFIEAGLTNEEGQILKKKSFPTLAHQGRDVVIEQISKAIDFSLQGTNNIVKGIGIGTPGVVDNRGYVFDSPNLPGWENLPLKDIFQEKYSLPVVVENDVNTIALGEFLFGAGKGSNIMICATLGTGVGGGIVYKGKIVRGKKYSAVELGHITIDHNGPQCKCGNYGCIERFVGKEYIIERAVKAIKEKKETIIYSLADKNLENITPKLIKEAFAKGDKVAEEILLDVGLCLGAFFTSLVNIFNPEIIVIGGGIAQDAEIIFETIRDTIKKRAMKKLAENVKVVPAGLGSETGIISAGALLFQKV